jgi:O-antigen/teichoic acid export membrane protein
MGYYQLLDPGLAQGVTKFVAQFRSSDDRESIYRSINTALLFQGVLGALGSLLLVLFADQILSLLNVSLGFYSEAKLGLYFCAVGFLAQILAKTFASSLKGLQCYDFTAKVDAGTSVIFHILGVIFLFSGGGLAGLIALRIASIVVSLFIFAYATWSKLGGSGFSYGFSKKDFKRLFSFSGFLFIGQLSGTFTNYIVRFVISFYLGPAAVTYYEVPKKLLNAIGGFLGSASSVLFPYASELQARRSDTRILSIYQKASKAFVSISTPIYLSVLIFSKHILTLWMDVSFAEKSWLILSVMAGTRLLGSLTTVPFNIALGLGYSKLKSKFSIAAVILYFMFLPLLIPRWGSLGAAIAVFCSSVFPGFLFVLYFTRNILEIRLDSYLKNVVSVNIIPTFLSLLLMPWVSRLSVSWIMILGPIIVVGFHFGLMAATGWIDLSEYVLLIQRKFSSGAVFDRKKG